jgi:hypothetical protein
MLQCLWNKLMNKPTDLCHLTISQKPWLVLEGTDVVDGQTQGGHQGNQALTQLPKLNSPVVLPAEGRQILLTVDRATNQDDLPSMSTALCDGSG